MQVGDPFMGKLLIEACLELFSEDVLEGIQDMGAAGLTSSSVEMAGRADNGVEIDLDSVPRRAKAMTPYEILLSESQERMLLVAKPGKEARVLEICARVGARRRRHREGDRHEALGHQGHAGLRPARARRPPSARPSSSATSPSAS